MSEKLEITVNEENVNRRYIGDLPNVPVERRLLLGPLNQYNNLLPIQLFLIKYVSYPCTTYCPVIYPNTLFHTTTIVNYIRDELKHDLNSDQTSQSYHFESKQMFFVTRLCDLGNGIIIEISDSNLCSNVENPNKLKSDYSDNYFLISSRLNIYYFPQHNTFVEELLDSFSKSNVFASIRSKSCTLQMVHRNINVYYLNPININKPLIIDLALYYGKNFVSIHEIIMKSLNKKEEKEIVLLHGIPDSEKTHYIRYLIHEIEDKTLIYVPPDMAKEISAPEFLPFLMQYQNAVLIIGDA